MKTLATSFQNSGPFEYSLALSNAKVRARSNSAWSYPNRNSLSCAPGADASAATSASWPGSIATRMRSAFPTASPLLSLPAGVIASVPAGGNTHGPRGWPVVYSLTSHPAFITHLRRCREPNQVLFGDCAEGQAALAPHPENGAAALARRLACGKCSWQAAILLGHL